MSGWFGHRTGMNGLDIVHELPFLPVSAIPASSEPGTRSCGRLSGFSFWFCFALPLLPQSRETSTIKIGLKAGGSGYFYSLIRALIVVDAGES